MDQLKSQTKPFEISKREVMEAWEDVRVSSLGVTTSHSRPKTSIDNPCSESQYETLKYRHDFPGRFGCIEDARAWCENFFTWYNLAHRYSGIASTLPSVCTSALPSRLREMRADVLADVYEKHPERLVRKALEPRSSPRPPGSTSPPTFSNDDQNIPAQR
ncbi:integrase core domain-containing protein [Streptomyces lavendulae]|uniref:integrase core domain-containing protein n=1 Tax=Streptomyces lavendulae TaxID=1914 RepID=UPI003F4D2BCA